MNADLSGQSENHSIGETFEMLGADCAKIAPTDIVVQLLLVTTTLSPNARLAMEVEMMEVPS